MARRGDHSHDEIKAMILNSAETIIKEEGFSALKVRRIAMDIGYTVASIYMVFSNMSDLNMHLKTRTCNALCSQLELTFAESGDIRVLAFKYLEFALDNHYLWRMNFECQLPFDDLLLNDYLHAQQRLVAIFKLCFLKYPEGGTQLASIFMSSLEGIIMQSLLSAQSRENTVSDVELFVQCFKT